MQLQKSEVWFLYQSLACGTGGEVYSVKNGATAYQPANRTFTYSNILECSVYEALAKANNLSPGKLTVADKWTLMIDAYFLFSRFVDEGFLELLDNTKKSGLRYRMTTAGAQWFENMCKYLHLTDKDDLMFFDSYEDMCNY